VAVDCFDGDIEKLYQSFVRHLKEEKAQGRTRDLFNDFKNIFEEKFGENIGVFCSN
jgi:hypothetical protein